MDHSDFARNVAIAAKSVAAGTCIALSNHWESLSPREQQETAEWLERLGRFCREKPEKVIGFCSFMIGNEMGPHVKA